MPSAVAVRRLDIAAAAVENRRCRTVGRRVAHQAEIAAAAVVVRQSMAVVVVADRRDTALEALRHLVGYKKLNQSTILIF